MINDVSLTAMGTAFQRSQETERMDRLFEDRFSTIFWNASKDFVKQQRQQKASQIERMHSPDIANILQTFTILRTRFFDDFVECSVDDGFRQVVILAAGLDCRPFRLRLTGDSKIFEIDLPGILKFKESVLADHRAVPNCCRTCILSDVTDDWHRDLLEAGFSPHRPTIWLMEGILPYLEQADVAKLLSSIADLSCAGSRCGFDDGQDLYRLFTEAYDIHEFGGVISINAPDIAVGELERHGWSVVGDCCSELASRYGRVDAKPLGKMWIASLP